MVNQSIYIGSSFQRSHQDAWFNRECQSVPKSWGWYVSPETNGCAAGWETKWWILQSSNPQSIPQCFIYVCSYCNLCLFTTLEDSEIVIFICELLSRPPCCWLGYHQFFCCWCPRPHSLALHCRLNFSLCYLDFLPGVPWSGGVVSFLGLPFWCSVGAIAVKVFKERLVRGIFLDSHILVI